MFSRSKIAVPVVLCLLVVAVGYRVWWDHQQGGHGLTSGAKTMDFRPSYSPDGKTVLFSRFRKLCVMEASGRNPRFIGKFLGLQESPCWSPDGKSIAFVCTADGTYDIWTATSEGKDGRNVTKDSAPDSFPCWSPDGKKVYFTKLVGTGTSIGCVELENGRSTILNPSDRSARCPACSPDGTLISYTSGKSGDRDIWVMDVDGKNSRLVATHPGHMDDFSSWSPDGKLLVFSCQDSGTRNLWIAPVSGGKGKPFTHHNEGHDMTPSFKPDGSCVIYARQTGEACQVMVTKVDAMQYAAND